MPACARRAPSKQMWEVNPGFGGPIKRDTLWFYATYRYYMNALSPPGAVFNLNANKPDVWTYAPDTGDRQPVERQHLQGPDGSLHLAGDAAQQDRGDVDRAAAVLLPRDHQRDCRAGRVGAARLHDPERHRRLDVAGDQPGAARGRGDSRTATSGDAPAVRVHQPGHGVGRRPGAGQPRLPRAAGDQQRAVAVPRHRVPHLVLSRRRPRTSPARTRSRSASISATQADPTTNFPATQPYNFRFNNGVPNQITLFATPSDVEFNADADLGVFAQDKWTDPPADAELRPALRLLQDVVPRADTRPRSAGADPQHHVAEDVGRVVARHLVPHRRGLRPVRRRQDRGQGDAEQVPAGQGDGGPFGLALAPANLVCRRRRGPGPTRTATSFPTAI